MTSSQSALFITVVFLGFFSGFVYDVFRILRKTFPHPDILTYVEDLIFWIFVSGFVFYFILNKNSGEVRFYIILGTFLGMGLYFLTLSRFVMAASMAVVNFIKRVLLALFKIVSLPVKLLLRLCMIPAERVKKTMRRAKKPVKKLLQKPVRYARIKKRGLARDMKIIMKKY